MYGNRIGSRAANPGMMPTTPAFVNLSVNFHPGSSIWMTPGNPAPSPHDRTRFSPRGHETPAFAAKSYRDARSTDDAAAI